MTVRDFPPFSIIFSVLFVPRCYRLVSNLFRYSSWLGSKEGYISLHPNGGSVGAVDSISDDRGTGAKVTPLKTEAPASCPRLMDSYNQGFRWVVIPRNALTITARIIASFQPT